MLTGIALPLAAIELLHATPAQIAAMNAAAIAPGIALGLFAAHAVDRVRRRPVLVARGPRARGAPARAAARRVRGRARDGARGGVRVLPRALRLRLQRGRAGVPAGAGSGARAGARERPAAGGRLERRGRGLRGGRLARAGAVGAARAPDRRALLPGVGGPDPADPHGRAAARAGRRGGRARDAGARSPRACARSRGAASCARSPRPRCSSPARSRWSAPSTCCSCTASSASRRDRSACCSRWARVSSLAAAFGSERVPERFAGLPAMTAGLAVAALGPLILALAPGATLLGVAAIAAQQIVGDGGYVLYEVHQRSLRQQDHAAPGARAGLGRDPLRRQPGHARRRRARRLAGRNDRSARDARRGGLRHGARRARSPPRRRAS